MSTKMHVIHIQFKKQNPTFCLIAVLLQPFVESACWPVFIVLPYYALFSNRAMFVVCAMVVITVLLATLFFLSVFSRMFPHSLSLIDLDELLSVFHAL